MITPEERRFLKYWMEQREGGKRSYLLHYVLVGTFIFTLILSVISFLFFQVLFGSWVFWSIFAAGVIVSIIAVSNSWKKNENRFKNLVMKLKEYLEEKERNQ